jgi:hypothetical protein
MKTFGLLVLMCLVCPLAALAQKVPTVEQCRADVSIWGNTDKYLEYVNAEDQHRDPQKPNTNNTELARLSLSEILMRTKEMVACDSVDGEKDARYVQAAYMYEHIWGDRMLNFLGRHNLWEQFKKEDAEGKR